jgi:hypothetical protein
MLRYRAFPSFRSLQIGELVEEAMTKYAERQGKTVAEVRSDMTSALLNDPSLIDSFVATSVQSAENPDSTANVNPSTPSLGN